MVCCVSSERITSNEGKLAKIWVYFWIFRKMIKIRAVFNKACGLIDIRTLLSEETSRSSRFLTENGVILTFTINLNPINEFLNSQKLFKIFYDDKKRLGFETLNIIGLKRI